MEVHKHQTQALIVTNNQMISAGIRMILQAQPHIAIMGEASSVHHALEIALRERPQIILIDLDMSGADVLGLIRDLLTRAEQSLVLILSDLRDGNLLREALSSGAVGVVLKVQPPAVLIAAIESLCTGESQSNRTKIPSTPFLHTSPRHTKLSEKELQRIHALTARERQVVGLIGKGLKNKEIADQLCISETTVRHHLTNIFGKLDVADRQQLLIWAHRYHFVDRPQSSDTA